MQSKLSLLFAFLFGAAPMLFAQVSAGTANQAVNVVLETEKVMSFGSRPCFRIEFANATPKMTEDVWKDFVKKNFSGKIAKNKKSDEYVSPGLKSAFMGPDPFTLYSTFEKTGANGTAINVWFDQGTAFLSRSGNAQRTDEVVRLLRQYYLDVRRAVITEEIKTQENKQKDLESKFKKLQRDNASMRKDIEEWKAKIQKAETDIVNNEKEQENTIAEQEAQRKVIEQVRLRLQNVENEKQ
jgi:hypothetical protein